MEVMVIQNFFTVKQFFINNSKSSKEYLLLTEISFEEHYQYIGILPLWLQWATLGILTTNLSITLLPRKKIIIGSQTMHSSNYIFLIANSYLPPTSNFDVHLSSSNPQPLSHSFTHSLTVSFMYSSHIHTPSKKLPCHPFLSHEF